MENTMKKLKLVLIAVVVIGLASCDLLDNQQPQQSLPIDDVVADAEGIRNLTTGMYDGIQSATIAGGNYNMLPELMADNVIWTGSFTTYADVHRREITTDNGNISGWWNNSYRSINLANLVLEALDEVDDPELSDQERNYLRGDAHFVRGMTLFELARVYSKPWGHTADNSHLGVPIRLDAVSSSEQFENLSRFSVAEVYNQAVTDLSLAADLLPLAHASDDITNRTPFRATSYSALGYLMRLEMQRQNYSQAADYADQIIQSGIFSLTESPEGPFRNEFSSESIFEVIHTSTDNPGVNAGQNAFYGTENMGGREDIQISDFYADAIRQTITDDQQQNIDALGYEAEELRATILLTTPDSDPGPALDIDEISGGQSATRKFLDAVTNADNVMNLRYADVLLTRAEALAEEAVDLLTVPQEVYDLVNSVRTRSIRVEDADGNDQSQLIEYDVTDFNNKEELIDAILLERRIELAFEGDRYHTLTRKGLDLRGVAPDEDRITFPIPQGEMDANPNIEQNPGY